MMGTVFTDVTRGTNSGWNQNTTPLVSSGLSPNMPYTLSLGMVDEKQGEIQKDHL